MSKLRGKSTLFMKLNDEKFEGYLTAAKLMGYNVDYCFYRNALGYTLENNNNKFEIIFLKNETDFCEVEFRQKDKILMKEHSYMCISFEQRELIYKKLIECL